jgi:hypothetical protein
MDDAIILHAEALPPAAVETVKLQQMRGGRSTAFELVHMDDLKPIIRARVVCSPPHAAHGSA